MKRQGYYIAATVTGLLLAGAAYAHYDRKRKDKVAAALLREVTRTIQPATTGLLAEDAFDIHYPDKILRQVSGQVLTLKQESASRLAERIHNSWGAWYSGGDTENLVYAVFRELKDKVQVAQVAKAYQDNYKENLIDKLYDRFDADEIKKVLAIVGPLPAYRKL